MNQSQPSDLLGALKRTFGFASFRPLQEAIIRDALAGKDVLALLPTGGGKSICFQLPAVLRGGLTVVVSPLIALMKDQVDGLQSAGVAATYLNSTLAAAESRARRRGLETGAYRLLYVAPERLLLSGAMAELQRWDVRQFAVDEAHCISEWGHDFRPEYRRLAELREVFPAVPMMALTATATPRVREDIVTQLPLRAPACYVSSFDRPNLTYRVFGKREAQRQIREFIRARARESGVIYCQARKTAETVAARLAADGVRAAAYHAGMPAPDRARHQEAFLRDEIRVVCATIAFGMGINKPNVRFVIHYDLPKNIESYYQETGRAGRDGLPADCVLLFTPGDAVKYGQFIEEMNDPREQQVARRQLQQMVHFAEASGCRRLELLAYFGETAASAGANCGACDNCLAPRATWDGTVASQKLMSCVHRIRERSGFDAGMRHVIEVLTGADTVKVRRWNHNALSTYGIGKELGREEWGVIGRELIRLGYLQQSSSQFSTVSLTPEGYQALRARKPITLTKGVATPAPPRVRPGEISCDDTLFESLRVLRKQLADERGLPPYIVFSDVSLRQMARYYPLTAEEFGRISGVGQKKLAEFGSAFMQQIRAHLAAHPRQLFADDSFRAPV
jgi:ATP-dependent DNA helicase RecQ